jgi:hypothetical protein
MAASGGSQRLLRQFVLTLDENGSPVYPGLLRLSKDVELVVRVMPNRNMYQVRAR